MSNNNLNKHFQKCKNCLKYNIDFNETTNKFIKDNDINIINDVCDCYYSKFKIIDIIINDDEKNNLIFFGSYDDISKQLIENIQSNTKYSNFYINSEEGTMPSPFSSANNLEFLIPKIIKNIFKSNLKEIFFSVNIIPTNMQNFFSKKNIIYKIKNLSYDSNIIL